MNLDNVITRKEGEEYLDYLVRLFENKNLYDLNCDGIAKLINCAFGKDHGESAYRKFYSAFEQGRQYERNVGKIGIATRILAISDLHVPFQLPIGTFSDYIGKVDVLVVNGDITDCQAISRFPKSYRISPMEEIIKSREYLIGLIEYLQPKQVILTYGNHDHRFSSYLNKNLDTDILELMPETPLDLIINDGFRHYDRRNKIKTWYSPLTEVFQDDDITIEYVEDWKCKVGKTWFAHPIAFSGGILKTAERAMEYFLRTDQSGFDVICIGHTHRVGMYKEGNIYIYEQGACCHTNKMSYTDGKLSFPQKEGFFYLCQDKNGEIIEDKSCLVNLN